MRPLYLLPASEVADITLAELGHILACRPRLVARDVTIGELATLDDHPTGVYLFYAPRTNWIQYVGKATSRSFIDRIPAHFDPRQDAWMNSLPKHIMKQRGCVYAEALKVALGLELTLIGASEELPGGRVEAVLRAHLHPELNFTKRRFDASLTLAEACATCA